jgi:N-methylhydantoinase B
VEIEYLIRANSRTPELVAGDIRGQIGAGRLGEKRFSELMLRYGKETILEADEALSSYTERTLRGAVASWPDGRGEGEAVVDHDGIDLDRPIRIRVHVDKKADRIHFDFTRSGDQTPGPANIRPPLVRACCYYALISLVDPLLPVNQGLSRVVEASFREGSVLHPRFPGAVNTYMPTAHAVVEAVFKALGTFVTDKRIAGGSGSAAVALGGRPGAGKAGYVQYEIFAGGSGARWGKDGVSASAAHLSNCRTAPIEIIESEFPTRTERFELIPDSGGAGAFRGGLGFVREYRVLEDDVRFSMRGDKHVVQPWGCEGGKDGRTGACIINPGTAGAKSLPSRFGDFTLKKGDLLRLERPGGGGIGSPLERARERVVDDVRQGYVRPESAESDYGVVVRASEPPFLG